MFTKINILPKKGESMSKKRKIILSVLAILLIINGAVVGYFYVVYNKPKMNSVIPNFSVESENSETKRPDKWVNSSWGENDAKFTYEHEGYKSNRSMKIEISSYKTGDAKWYFDEVQAIGGQTYYFEDYYKSNVTSEVVVSMTKRGGGNIYQHLGYVASSDKWKTFSTKFSVPSDITSFTIYHLINAQGYLTTDNYVLNLSTPGKALSSGIVSITFDDGWKSSYENGLPILDKNNFPATHYFVTSYLGKTNYLSDENVKTFLEKGHQIGSHSVSHARLDTLSTKEVEAELKNSKKSLEEKFGKADSFSIPYGAQNNELLSVAKKYYKSVRTSDTGYNEGETFEPNNIRIQFVTVTTTKEQFQSWVDKAVKDKVWLVLLYHRIDASGDYYSTTKENFDAQMKVVKDSKIRVMTVDQAVQEIE